MLYCTSPSFMRLSVLISDMSLMRPMYVSLGPAEQDMQADPPDEITSYSYIRAACSSGPTITSISPTTGTSQQERFTRCNRG